MVEINSVIEYLNVIGNKGLYDPGSVARPVVFRGQPKFQYGLMPSFGRFIGEKDNGKNPHNLEQESIRLFKQRAFLLQSKFKTKDDNISALMDMQHYSFPTRLLDWSYSPLVSLYFSVNKDFNNDGALFAWRYFDLSSLKTINKIENHLLRSQLEEIYGKSWFAYIPSEDFEFVILIDHADHINERMHIQQGCFTVSNNWKADHEKGIKGMKNEHADELYKYRIPAKSKKRILSELKFMNISSGHLFPGMDGVGQEFAEQLLIEY